MKTTKTAAEIMNIMAELASYTEMMDEPKLQAQYMTETGTDEVIGMNGEKATWRGVISNRFDSTAFKKDFLDIYKEYTKRTEYKRFTFAR